jgi:hypothetical protein
MMNKILLGLAFSLTASVAFAQVIEDEAGSITLGGTAQNVFSGRVPANGYEVCNSDATNDLWLSNTGTAAANSAGSVRVPANGGCYITRPGYQPQKAVSIVGANTAQKFTAKKW